MRMTRGVVSGIIPRNHSLIGKGLNVKIIEQKGVSLNFGACSHVWHSVTRKLLCTIELWDFVVACLRHYKNRKFVLATLLIIE